MLRLVAGSGRQRHRGILHAVGTDEMLKWGIGIIVHGSHQYRVVTHDQIVLNGPSSVANVPQGSGTAPTGIGRIGAHHQLTDKRAAHSGVTRLCVSRVQRTMLIDDGSLTVVLNGDGRILIDETVIGGHHSMTPRTVRLTDGGFDLTMLMHEVVEFRRRIVSHSTIVYLLSGLTVDHNLMVATLRAFVLTSLGTGNGERLHVDHVVQSGRTVLD